MPTSAPIVHEATLRLLSRPEIQRLARANGIKANLKTVVIIKQLVEQSKSRKINASAIVPKREEQEPSLQYHEEPNANMNQPAADDAPQEALPRRQEPVFESISMAGVRKTNRDAAPSGSAVNPSARRRVRFPPSVSAPEGYSEEIIEGNANSSRDQSRVQVSPGRKGTHVPVVQTDPASDPGEASSSFGVPMLLVGDAAPAASPAPQCTAGQRPVVRKRALDSSLPPSSPPQNTSSEDKLLPQRPIELIAHPLRLSQLRKSSPLPPSSPPRDSTPPPVEQPEDTGALETPESSFWNRTEYDSQGQPISYDFAGDEFEETSLFMSSNARALRAAKRAAADGADQEEAHGVDEQQNGERDEREYEGLPTPGSGDSAYSLSDYEPPSDGFTYAPEPADDRMLIRAVNSMSSLSAIYRGSLRRCQEIVQDVHNTRMDAIITHREVSQENAMALRLAQWLAFWANPAKKWHDSSLWKYPINLKVVDGQYEEVISSDDENEPAHGRTELKRCWNEEDYVATLAPLPQDDAAEETDDDDETPTSPSPSGPRTRAQSAASASASEPSINKNSPTWNYILGKHARPEEDEEEEEDFDEDADYLRGSGGKFPRLALPHIVAPLMHTYDALEQPSFSNANAASSPAQGQMSTVLEEEEEEDYIDEKSVESILDGEEPQFVGSANESWNPFLAEDDEESGSVEVEDDAGERHRRYSFEAKGKGRAL